MIEYILVLTLQDASITVYPKYYRDKQDCEIAGTYWKQTTQEDFGWASDRGISFVCIPEVKDD